jgi:hypothetical protein
VRTPRQTFTLIGRYLQKIERTQSCPGERPAAAIQTAIHPRFKQAFDVGQFCSIAPAASSVLLIYFRALL